MGWKETREAVRLAIAKALKLEDETDQLGGDLHVVEWENRAGDARMVGATFADLRFSGPVAIGTDEIRYSYDCLYDRLTPEYGGFRVFGVQVLCQSDSQEPDEDAVGVMGGRLRTRLRRLEILDILKAAGVSLIRISPSIDVSYTNQEGRAMSASSTDLSFGCLEVDRDEDESVPYIECVSADGVIRQETKEDIEFPIQIP